jgi:hypothetical protein
MQRELPVAIIKRKKIYRGGSRNNPYVTDNEFTYTSTVYPRNLASNVISMREVLADEWVKDLTLIEAENVELLRHHNEMVRNLEDRALPFIPPRHEDCDQNTPLRLSSYDLLEKLVTEAAVRRIIDELSRGPASDRHAGRWLYEQFHGPAGEGFRGDHGAEIGRTFMRHLLAAVPVVGADTLVHPVEVASKVMVEREQVADRMAQRLAETKDIHARWTLALLQACLSRPTAVRPGPPPAGAGEPQHGGGGGGGGGSGGSDAKR